MSAQADDAGTQSISVIELPRDIFIRVTWNIAQRLTLPFHANRIIIVRVAGLTHQPQQVSNLHM